MHNLIKALYKKDKKLALKVAVVSKYKVISDSDEKYIEDFEKLLSSVQTPLKNMQVFIKFKEYSRADANYGLHYKRRKTPLASISVLNNRISLRADPWTYTRETGYPEYKGKFTMELKNPTKKEIVEYLAVLIKLFEKQKDKKG